jgi:hypothetical protein
MKPILNIGDRELALQAEVESLRARNKELLEMLAKPLGGRIYQGEKRDKDDYEITSFFYGCPNDTTKRYLK